jgi:hypothetical protein
MKNKLLFPAFLFLFSSIISCTNKKVSIVGKWKPVEMDVRDSEFNKKSEADKKQELASESIEFTADGKFIALSSHDPVQGTYAYDEKTKSLVTVVEGKTESLTIESLEKNKMVLIDKEGKITLKRD